MTLWIERRVPRRCGYKPSACRASNNPSPHGGRPGARLLSPAQTQADLPPHPASSGRRYQPATSLFAKSFLPQYETRPRMLPACRSQVFQPLLMRADISRLPDSVARDFRPLVGDGERDGQWPLSSSGVQRIRTPLPHWDGDLCGRFDGRLRALRPSPGASCETGVRLRGEMFVRRALRLGWRRLPCQFAIDAPAS